MHYIPDTVLDSSIVWVNTYEARTSSGRAKWTTCVDIFAAKADADVSLRALQTEPSHYRNIRQEQNVVYHKGIHRSQYPGTPVGDALADIAARSAA